MRKRSLVRIFVPGFLLTWSLSGPPPMAFADEASDFEVRGTPLLGWNSGSDLSYGLDGSMLYSLSEHWQWQLGGSFITESGGDRDTNYTLYTGPVYNFGDDRSRAFFVGFGGGYGDRLPYLSDEESDRAAFAYAELGKRFRLNDSGSFAWTPLITGYTNLDDRALFTISPLNFSWSF